jgi:hypothetical protein
VYLPGRGLRFGNGGGGVSAEDGAIEWFGLGEIYC